MRRGFTLVELIVLMGVIGILSGMSIPVWRGYQQKAQIKKQAYAVADFMYAAEEQTLAEQDIYGVIMTSTTYSLLTYGESYEGQEPTVVETKSLSPNFSLTDNTIVDATSGDNEVRFSRSGVPSTTGTVQVGYTDGGPSYQIEVTPSGAIKVNANQ